MARCAADPLYWINTYTMTFDPRQESAEIPMTLYPFQEDIVQKLVHHITTGEDLLLEKSRDMGVSWVILLVFQWFWLFKPGATFLLGSRRQDAVDSPNDISSLMEKLRYNLYRLPPWMQPEGFRKDRHATFCKLFNPTNGNTITGEAATANFARGGRYKAVFMDEFAYWQWDDWAFASAGQSTPCRIVASTPHGMANRFAQLRHDSKIEVETVHWRRHPHKTQEWYETQCRRMTVDEVARELDINYNLSSRDRVFQEFTVDSMRDVSYNRFLPVIRSWDFGYHVPACVFLQIDIKGRLLVLHEEVGERIQFHPFVEKVLAVSASKFADARFEDIADPAGNQRSDKSDLTNLEIMARFGLYPAVQSHVVFDEVTLLRELMSDNVESLPGLLVHNDCKVTIAALQGGYRFTHDGKHIIEEHPYEDVVDCLRYAASHKSHLLKKHKPYGGKRGASNYLSHLYRNPYTQYPE